MSPTRCAKRLGQATCGDRCCCPMASGYGTVHCLPACSHKHLRRCITHPNALGPVIHKGLGRREVVIVDLRGEVQRASSQSRPHGICPANLASYGARPSLKSVVPYPSRHLPPTTHLLVPGIDRHVAAHAAVGTAARGVSDQVHKVIGSGHRWGHDRWAANWRTREFAAVRQKGLM